MSYGGFAWELRESIESCALLAFESEDALYWTFETETKKCHLKASIRLGADRRDNTLGHVSGSSECGNAHLYSGGEYPR